MKYIAYYRVSTKHQGIEGLGMQSQQNMVEQFLKGEKPAAEYREVESGKKKDRPELLKAIEHCKQTDATLLVAKLDRLSRDIHFITTLQKEQVKFKCCDMPEADNFTIHIFAALAQKEREMISTRTKSALKVLKEQGKKLGNPNLANEEYKFSLTQKMREARTPYQVPDAVRVLVQKMQGEPLKDIATALNDSKHKTAQGKAFTSTQVHRIQKHLNPSSKEYFTVSP